MMFVIALSIAYRTRQWTVYLRDDSSVPFFGCAMTKVLAPRRPEGVNILIIKYPLLADELEIMASEPSVI